MKELLKDMSHLEQQFAVLWEERYPNIDLFFDSVKPIDGRQFRLDFASVESKVAIEIQGGLRIASGGHNLGKDYEKLNLCQEQGWIIYLLAPQHITTEWIDRIALIIENRIKIR